MPGKRLLSEQFVGALTPSLSGGKEVLQLDYVSTMLAAQESFLLTLRTRRNGRRGPRSDSRVDAAFRN